MARRRSRDPKKEKFWQRMVQRQLGSGLSVRAWCHKHGLREPSFYGWRRQLLRREAESRPALVPVTVTAGPSAGQAYDRSRIEIVLPHERRVTVIGPVDRQALADVLAAVMSTNPTASGAASC